METLDDIIRDATAAIPGEYFLLPVYGAPAVNRERVYCYELYHQMRLRWPEHSPWFLNGEVDKGGHAYFAGENAPKPDFLVHVPGQDINFAALEVKPAKFKNKELRKDLETLQRFRGHRYQRAIILLFGLSQENALRRFQNCCTRPESFWGVELWAHVRVGEPAVRIEAAIGG